MRRLLPALAMLAAAAALLLFLPRSCPGCDDFAVDQAGAAYLIACALVGGEAGIPDPVPPATFSDVPDTFWAYKYVEYAVSQNIVKGYPDGSFRPHETASRAQMAVYIARAMVTPSGDAGIPDPVPPATFSDVPDTFWAYKQVEFLWAQGLAIAYSTAPLQFAPDAPMMAFEATSWLEQAGFGTQDPCGLRLTDFAALPLSGPAPLTVNFTDLSRGDLTSWLWDFGDGGTSTTRNPSHTYTDAGSYTVTLTTWAWDGKDFCVKQGLVMVLPPLPVADFAAAPVTGTVPLTVSFIDVSTGWATSWAWAFGDEGVSTERNPVHEYEEAGSYTVTLTVGNSGGTTTKTKARCIVVTFADVPPGSWAFDQVMACVDANIVKGYDDGLYHPERQVTRDQMAVYIARAMVTPSGDAGIPDPVPPPTFSDVPSTHWAYKHIEYAVSQNVVKGYDDGTYKPDLVVDRGQMAVFVARAMVTPSGEAGIPDPVPPATFSDVPDTFWAYKQVEYCVGQGVVKGYDDGTYRPGDPVTRDQMAVYAARAFKLPL